MSELILTKTERKSTWAECNDKTMADILRHCLVITGNINSDKQDISAMAAGCDALNLIKLAYETNAKKLTITQDRVTVGNKIIGNYEIVITKIN